MGSSLDRHMTSATRVPLIAGNWKMYKTLEEARALASSVVDALGACRTFRAGELDVGLFPPATALAAVAQVVGRAPSRILVGAQNMHFEDQGAFTGEVSAAMIRSCGATAVILGHSERRHIFGESEEDIGKKVAAALRAGLTPILCVGEKIEERDRGLTLEVVRRQLESGLAKVERADEVAKVVIAYEPVWAIGTGRNATPAIAQEVQAFVRGELERILTERGGSATWAGGVRILYGGSVKPGNARELLAEPDIDGALVGGASLEAESFVAICRGCER
jgi:triosephosphate isomerase